ncbi:MAG: hypothetical protein WC307_05040 [Candidatus Nanoarchaeia archaeon]
MKEKKIEYIHIDELKPYALNAKIHSPEQIKKIAESIEHILSKLGIYRYIKRNFMECITEAKFIKEGRADVYLLNKDLAIEVINSEKEKNIEIKKAKYPCEIIIFDSHKIKTEEELNAWCDDNINPNN